MPHDSKLVLFSMRFCPYAQRAHLVLNAKNIPHHVFFINLVDKPEWYLTINPNGRVPALLLKNEPHHPVLVESLVICEYLDEKYPDVKLYPADPLHKAETKLWIERFDSCHGAFYQLIFVKNDDDTVNQKMTELLTTVSEFEVELSKRGTDYFGGDHPNILDYAIWPWFERLGVLKSLFGDKNKFDEHHYPTLVSDLVDIHMNVVRCYNIYIFCFSYQFKWIHSMTKQPAVEKHLISAYTHGKYVESRRNGKANCNLLDEETESD